MQNISLPNEKIISREVYLLEKGVFVMLWKEKGYTNYEHFAYKHGFNRAQYGRYENGANISFKTLVKIVAAFDMTLEEFFAEGFTNTDV